MNLGGAMRSETPGNLQPSAGVRRWPVEGKIGKQLVIRSGIRGSAETRRRARLTEEIRTYAGGLRRRVTPRITAQHTMHFQIMRDADPIGDNTIPCRMHEPPEGTVELPAGRGRGIEH
jgi:hypothetical protein